MSMDLPQQVEARLAAALADDHVPQIVLDLDGTLFDNVPRSKRILLDAARQRLGEDHPAVARIEAIGSEAFEYNPLDTLRKAGVADEPTLETLRLEWVARFFDSAYLDHDVPLQGAVAACLLWWAKGAELNYLTGRHVPEMFLGTCRSLHDAGFPIGTLRTQLIMKPRYDQNDVAFKIETIPAVGRKGPIVLLVDNDPRVLNELCRMVPDALAVMVKTLYPKDAPEPDATILRVQDFQSFLPPLAITAPGAHSAAVPPAPPGSR